MYLCYLDESGTPELPGNTSHYVLAGIAIPVWHWRTCDRDISAIRNKYGLADAELHTAWILRPYREQRIIPGFDTMTYMERAASVEQWRRSELLRLQRYRNPAQYRQSRKNFRKTAQYVHLTFDERKQLMIDVARCVSEWGFARLFAECIDKINFSPGRTAAVADEAALEQLVSRFEHFLIAMSSGHEHPKHGLLIHDNNETVAKRHTDLMMKFHREGTPWVDLVHIMETPLFVNSELTNMVQIADLCAYALRRYLENSESELFDLIFQRADRLSGGNVVGVRHFSPKGCTCKICSERGRPGVAI